MLQSHLAPSAAPIKASRRSWRGLDWCIFFVADVQTGFGAFVAVFLTEQKWTQVDIGFLLTISGLVGLFAQAPCGAVVDAARSERALAAVALAVIAASAFAFATWPVFLVAIASRVALAIASTILGLAIVAISVGLAREHGLARRLGRNAAFASAGTGLAALLMGACGYYLSARDVFYISGALTLPAMAALLFIRPSEIAPASDAARGVKTDPAAQFANFLALIRQPGLLIFALCVMMFHLANAAMLPLAASLVTQRSGKTATLLVAAAIVIPQFTVTGLSLVVGRLADSWGRRPLLLCGFGALAVRGVLFALTRDPMTLVAIQLLDGVSAAALGVLVPLIIADLTRERGHFNLAQGSIGCAMGVGASISTTLSGYVTDRYGGAPAFDMLAIFAVVGLVLLALAMPETRPPKPKP
ncbi:MAG TPA: MFS transporter [Roseiarcus sp.]|nr:MFS transporter [Roseiarcus sp.]